MNLPPCSLFIDLSCSLSVVSRPKRNIARDFSDGMMLAEVVAAYFPTFVELHNYSPAHSIQQKLYNFDTLNQRVLKKLGFQIPRPVIEDIVNCRPGAIENVLNALQYKMAKYREKVKKKSGGGSGESVGGNNSALKREQKNNNNSDNMNDNKKISSENNVPSNKPVAGAVGMGNGRGGKGAAAPSNAQRMNVDEEILFEKEQQIRELQETVEILELKVAKLEQLVRLKDNKIGKLIAMNEGQNK